MTESTSQPETTRLYQLYRLLIIPALLWYVLMAYYTATRPTGVVQIYTSWLPLFGVFVITPLNIILGLLIMRRLPNNVLGPALIVFACGVTSEMAVDLIVPLAQGALSEFVLTVFMFPSMITLIVYFPDGKLPTQWASSIFGILYSLFFIGGTINLFINPYSFGTNHWNGEYLPNPFAIEAFAPIGEPFATIIGPILLILLPLTGILIAVYRYIHTTYLERKQMRIVLFGFFLPIFLISLPQNLGVSVATVIAATAGIILVSTTLPLAIAVGVLFYRLWDIDVIIRRTLIYSVVSLLLALTYFAIVLTTQTLLSGFIPKDNTLLIVVSTLVIAALFNPLQQRVQQVIDRLFYRKRYDTAVTLEQFSENMRDAMDADTIEHEILTTIASTIQPESISLWVVERSSKS